MAKSKKITGFTAPAGFTGVVNLPTSIESKLVKSINSDIFANKGVTKIITNTMSDDTPSGAPWGATEAEMKYKDFETIAKPTISGSFTYDGEAKSPTITGFDSSTMEKSGPESRTNAGEYTILVNPKTGYKWSDGTSTTVQLIWTIAKMELTIPSLSGSYTYSGSEQAVTVNDFNSTYETQTGDASATNAGDYTVYWNLKDTTNTCWTDKTTAQRSGDWSIAKLALTIPSLSGSYTYSGEAQSVTVNDFNNVYESQSGEASGTNAGTYTVKWNLNDTTNTCWTDESIVEKSANWEIAKAAGTLSIEPTSITLSNSTLSANITITSNCLGTINCGSLSGVSTSVAGNVVTVTGDGETAISGGSMTISVTPDGNHNAPEAVSAIVNASYYINVDVPTLTGSYTYNGSAQTVSMTGFVDAGMTKTGDTATDAGTHTVTFSLKAGYRWSDLTFEDKTATWTIAQKSISGATITLNNSLTYNGSSQTQYVASVIIDSLSATYTVSGNTGTNAGSYTLTCTGTGNFTGTQTKSWSIAKADGTLSADKTAVIFLHNSLTQTVTLTSNCIGTISAAVPTGISYSVSGNVITFTLDGTTRFTAQTITISVTPSDPNNYTTPADVILRTATQFVTDLTDTTWLLNLDAEAGTSNSYAINYSSYWIDDFTEFLAPFGSPTDEYNCYYYTILDYSEAYGVNTSRTTYGWIMGYEEDFIDDSRWQTISITGGTDVTNTTLINWLYNNATTSSVAQCAITYNLTKITSASTNPSKIGIGKSSTLIFNSTEGYILPKTISVTGADYTYTHTDSTGTVEISNVTGPVTITIVSDTAALYNITYNLTNCSGDSSNPSTIYAGWSAALKFTSISNYYIPKEITVIGADYTWTRNDSMNATLVISNAQSNVSITISSPICTYKTFSLCTMAEINTICEAGNAAAAVAEGSWTIGDINYNATYGSYSGVRLVHVLTDTQRGSDYYGTEGHIVVEFVNTIISRQWHSSDTAQTSYSASTILTSTLASTIYSGLNSDFKSVLKLFAPSTSVQSSSSSGSAITSIEHPSGYLHLANAIEVGSTNSYRPSENDYSFCFTYYSNSSTAATCRQKSGVLTTWWLRSPHYCRLYFGSYYAHLVQGSAVNGAGVRCYCGVAPIAVI